MEDVLAHVGEDRPRTLQGGGCTADHKGQGAGRRAGGAARDGRIEQGNAARSGRQMDFACSLRSDGRTFQYQTAGRDHAKQTGVTQVQPFHMATGRQHADHHFGSADGIRGAAGGAGTLRGQFIHGAGHQIKHAEAVAGVEQVAGHGQAHMAKADKSDLSHCYCSPRCECRA